MDHEEEKALLLTRARRLHDGVLTAVAAGFLATEQDVLPLVRECAVLFHEAEIDEMTHEELGAVVYHVTALERLVRQVGELMQVYRRILTPETPNNAEAILRQDKPDNQL